MRCLGSSPRVKLGSTRYTAAGGAREADGDAARAPQPSCTALCVWGGGRDRPRHVPVLGSDSVPAPMGTSGQTWDMCRVYNDPYGSQ